MELDPGSCSLLSGEVSMAIKTFEAKRAMVGSRAGEFYLKLEDYVIILPPPAAKALAVELKKLLPPDPPRREESVPKKVIKALYKSRKVTKSLISINTGRRKKLPDG